METMYNKYIDPKGEQQVNISDAEKIHIEQRMMGDEQTKGSVCFVFHGATASSCTRTNAVFSLLGVPPIDLFDEATEEIYKLMERDNYRRFKKSKFFQGNVNVPLICKQHSTESSFDIVCHVC
jgi:hypothetical protein